MFFGLSNVIISQKNTQLNECLPLAIFPLFLVCFTALPPPLLCFPPPFVSRVNLPLVLLLLLNLIS